MTSERNKAKTIMGDPLVLVIGFSLADESLAEAA